MLGSLGVPVIARSLFPIGSPYYYATITRGHAHPHGPTYRTPMADRRVPCSVRMFVRTGHAAPERNAGDDTSRYRARPGLPPTNAHCAAARACGSTFHVTGLR